MIDKNNVRKEMQSWVDAKAQANHAEKKNKANGLWTEVAKKQKEHW